MTPRRTCSEHPGRFERPCRLCAVERAAAGRGRRLTPMQEAFAQAYVRLALTMLHPGAAAARHAGYAPKWAKRRAITLLRNELVRQRIAELAALAWGREPTTWSDPEPKRHYRLKRQPPPPPPVITLDMLLAPRGRAPAGRLPGEPQTATQRQHLSEVRRLLDGLGEPEPWSHLPGSELL